MTDLTEEQLAELIAFLPPAPAGWVQAATELPRARAVIDELAIRASEDAQRRQTILAGLEQALRDAGLEPRRHLVAQLQARLRQPPE